jgi:enterochelin esterase-like enzyme
MQIFTVTNPWTEEDISGRVYTPPCYGEDPDQEYPTLYLLHGAIATDQQWDELGIDEAADQLIARGDIPPLLIILPKEDTWISLPENPFGNQIVTDLVPWVDTHYQTAADRQYRAIGGLSRGGNWAVRIGFLHWALFGTIGAHSTPLFFGDLDRLPNWFEGIPPSKIPRIYLDIGKDDNNREDATAFAAKLSTLGIPHTWQVSPGLHDESYWGSHLEEYLLWYSAEWDSE